jgi:hypothetical protein
VKAFDEKLAKLGYHENSGKQKRSHHTKRPAAPGRRYSGETEREVK